MEYPLVDINEVTGTKERILLAASRLFSERGYAAVSVRDIADSVQIKPASIYNHFNSKEELFDSIIETVQNVYLDFYERMDSRLAQCRCFRGVLNCLFSELIDVYHMFIYFGVTLITVEQFRNEKARRAFNDVFMKIGIDYSDKVFRGCIEKGWVREFDTRILATFFMNNILAGSLIRTQEGLGNEMVYNASKMFTALREFMISSVEIIA